MKIEVTPSDILNGNSRCSESCPVAKALSKVVRDSLRVRVSKKYITFHYGKTCDVHTSPPNVIRFVEKFDSLESVTPFSFELDIPKEYLKDCR